MVRITTLALELSGLTISSVRGSSANIFLYFVVVVRPTVARITELVPALSGWTISGVRVRNAPWRSVDLTRGEVTTAGTARISLSSAGHQKVSK